MVKTLTPYGADCYDVPENLHVQYHGAGYALVAIKDDVLVAIQYLRNIDGEFDFDDDDLECGESVHDRLKNIIADDRVGHVSKLLNSLGNVHIGMMSCYQFIEM